MKVLFIHQNFPAQFKFLAPALAEAGHSVFALMPQRANEKVWQGVTVLNYNIARGNIPGLHEWLVDFESKTIRAEAVYRAALAYKENGLSPDVIIAHPGWGESLLIKEVWPDATLALYCEFYYAVSGLDVGFDPEFRKNNPGETGRLIWKNLNNLLHFEYADAGISPTAWQAATYPASFQSKIFICHDGIDTEVIAPNPQISLLLNGDKKVSAGDPVVTFVSRNLEPYRGFHTFMRALPTLLALQPTATIIIVGEENKGYGEVDESGRSWKALLAEEIHPALTTGQWERIHFLGRVPHETFLSVLQVSAVHVYLTYPFVLSWSLLEAMSAGCAVVASDTGPVTEVVMHDITGMLVDFFDAPGLAGEISALLDSPADRRRLGAAARSFVRDNYDLERKCLPQQMAWVECLRAGKT